MSSDSFSQNSLKIEKSTGLISQNSFVYDIISLLKKCQPSLTEMENFNIMKSESSSVLVADIGLLRGTFFENISIVYNSVTSSKSSRASVLFVFAL